MYAIYAALTFFIGPALFFYIVTFGNTNLDNVDIAKVIIPYWLMLFLFLFMFIMFSG